VAIVSYLSPLSSAGSYRVNSLSGSFFLEAGAVQVFATIGIEARWVRYRELFVVAHENLRQSCVHGCKEKGLSEAVPNIWTVSFRSRGSR
jgi:hypothetical protein